MRNELHWRSKITVKTETRSIAIRKLSLADIPEMLMVEKLAWPDSKQQFSKENFKSQLRIFSNGCFGIYVDGKLAGMLNGLILSKSVFFKKDYSWYSLTDNGNFKSHNGKGKIFFVGSLSVNPAYQGLGLGKLLLEKAKSFVISNRLESVMLGSRIPDYKKFKSRYTPIQYLNKYKKHELSDWLLRFYENAKFKPKSVIPNYFYDPDSSNAGVLMIWDNKDSK